MKTVPMFHPYVNDEAKKLVQSTLDSKWIAQGPFVDNFEEKFGQHIGSTYNVAVNSGTTALTLAYHLADIGEGDEVIVPVLTCAATNIPLIHAGAKVVFADIDPETLNISQESINEKLTPRTKAVVNVHLSGNKSRIESPVTVIGDYAQHHEKLWDGDDYACFSFQAIKQITTGDGGMLCVKDEEEYKRAKRLRWFGIDRERPKNPNDKPYQGRGMTTDIEEAGWKYHMNDISAAMGLGALTTYSNIIEWHHWIESAYRNGLKDIPGLKVIGGSWSFPILVEKRDEFAAKLLENGIETNMIQCRNDILTIFGGKRQDLPNMNAIEDKYLYLPLHMKVSIADVNLICKLAKEGW